MEAVKLELLRSYDPCFFSVVNTVDFITRSVQSQLHICAVSFLKRARLVLPRNPGKLEEMRTVYLMCIFRLCICVIVDDVSWPTSVWLCSDFRHYAV